MTSIVSYAQNFEDVILWRALGHIEKGFYIDLGAQDPLVDSVSLAFYERGWRGIHVEPVSRYADLLRQQRAEDEVIEAAVSDKEGALTFYEISETGISTADRHIAAQHKERGFEINEVTVNSVSLSSVFERCKGRDIHWLKIDIEGSERSALSSWGSGADRPWIIVVESTAPLTQIESHQEWESLLLKKGYIPVYFDGLNRFYVSKKKESLCAAFHAPPNVFDDFRLNGTASNSFHRKIDERHSAAIGRLERLVREAESRNSEVLAELSRREQAHLIAIESLKRDVVGSESTVEQLRGQIELTTNEIAELRTKAQLQLGAVQADYERALLSAAQETKRVALEADLRQKEVAKDFERLELVWRDELSKRELAAKLAAEKLQKLASAEIGDLRAKLTVLADALEQRTLQLASVASEVADREIAHNQQLNALQSGFTRQVAEVSQAAMRERMALENRHSEALAAQAASTEKENKQLISRHHRELERLGAQLIELQQTTSLAKQEAEKLHKLEVQSLLQAMREIEAISKDEITRIYREASNEQQIQQQQYELRLRQLNEKHDEAQKVVRQAASERENKLLDQLSAVRQDNKDLRSSVEVRSGEYLQELTEVRKGARLQSEMYAERERHLLGLLATVSQHRLALLRGEAGSAADIAFQQISRSFEQTDVLGVGAQLLGPGADTNLQPEIFRLREMDFVRRAYQMVLGRDADPEGASHFMKKLDDGAAKIQVLAMLRLSPEGRDRAQSVTNLDQSLAISTDASAPPRTLQDLLALQGTNFIRAIYLVLLGRHPDLGGGENCVRQLSAGTSKIEVISQIVASAEFHARARNLEGVFTWAYATVGAEASPEKSDFDSNIPADATSTPTSDRLMALVDFDFVIEAFRCICGRRPDPATFGVYFDRLIAQKSRQHFVRLLAESHEGIAFRDLNKDVLRAVRHFKMRASFIGGGVARLLNLKGGLFDQDLPRSIRASQFVSALRIEYLEKKFTLSDRKINDAIACVLSGANIVTSNVSRVLSPSAPDILRPAKQKLPSLSRQAARIFALLTSEENGASKK